MVAPLVEKTPGLYQVLTAANTDYPVVIPAGAKVAPLPPVRACPSGARTRRPAPS